MIVNGGIYMEFIDMLSNNLAVIIGVIVAVLILIVIVTGYVNVTLA